MTASKSKILVLELNEFNRDLLRSSALRFKFKHLEWLLSLKETRTRTVDTLQSDRLEPWVQWVNVHTGVPSQVHGIRHLGDVPELSHPQIWEELSKRGVTTGVWGPLNADKGDAENCLFFVPDPWTFSAHESPDDLRGLIDFPRYVTKNRVELRWSSAVAKLFKFCRLLPLGLWMDFALKAPAILRTQLAYRASASPLFLLFEYASAWVFTERTRRDRPEVAFLFLNSIAHLQHYYWRDENAREGGRIYWLFYWMNDLVGFLREKLGGEYSMLVLNALTQNQTAEKSAAHIYRIRDYDVFLPLLGIRPAKVEALMTYDATLFFRTRDERDSAAKALSEITIEGHPFFKVETEGHPENRLFFRTDYFQAVASGTHLRTGSGLTLPFDEHVVLLARQTGSHGAIGTVYAENLDLPAELPNHEILHKALEPWMRPSSAVHEKVVLAQNRR